MLRDAKFQLILVSLRRVLYIIIYFLIEYTIFIILSCHWDSLILFFISCWLSVACLLGHHGLYFRSYFVWLPDAQTPCQCCPENREIRINTFPKSHRLNLFLIFSPLSIPRQLFMAFQKIRYQLPYMLRSLGWPKQQQQPPFAIHKFFLNMASLFIILFEKKLINHLTLVFLNVFVHRTQIILMKKMF